MNAQDKIKVENILTKAVMFAQIKLDRTKKLFDNEEGNICIEDDAAALADLQFALRTIKNA